MGSCGGCTSSMGGGSSYCGTGSVPTSGAASLYAAPGSLTVSTSSPARKSASASALCAAETEICGACEIESCSLSSNMAGNLLSVPRKTGIQPDLMGDGVRIPAATDRIENSL